MKKIDRETVQKILDTADIVEVVSDFVSLKRRGANYIGLCPFHNERTPSFSVSKSKGICKCFSCGKGGSPVNFLMELEQLSYNEALRYLARKYNIEIVEHEMSDAERQAASERESLLAVNDFALKHFEHNLLETSEGKDIGYSYFRERGINDVSIRRFHLGYAIDKSDDLSRAALAQGYNEKYLVDTGLCSASERGGLYDRFKGRVIYPVFGVSGKIVAFGGRTLRKDKNVAKYVNSPESVIYSKSRELYGLYQAKGQIVRKNKCILVEGYMDVISMSQAGVENVVASSGTSLTEGQIRLIHRFTNNVTVIYDSDAAGIKASLRGIDMLLAEDMDIKVLLLPDGDDPDSFAQSHSAQEVEDYISENETDFIRFKTDILLRGAGDDPIKRASVISDIIRSIAVIPDGVKRQVYVQECSRMLNMDEKVLSLQLAKAMAQYAEKVAAERQRAAARDSIRTIVPDVDSPSQSAEDTPVDPELARAVSESVNGGGGQKEVSDEEGKASLRLKKLAPYEREIVRYIVKYGFYDFCDMAGDDGSVMPMSVIQFFNDEFVREDMSFINPLYTTLFNRAIEIYTSEWPADREAHARSVEQTLEQERQKGIDEIRTEAKDMADIAAREQALKIRIDVLRDELDTTFAVQYLSQRFVNDPDDKLRRLANDLIADRHQLSKVHTKYAHIETERERLADLCPRAFYELMNATLSCDIADIMLEIAQAQSQGDVQRQMSLITTLIEKKSLASDFARYLGERVITPRT